MQRELYEVEKDRFDLKDSSVYHLQGTWPKDYKAEAVLDGEPLSVVISAQERVSALKFVCRQNWKEKRNLVSMQ